MSRRHARSLAAVLAAVLAAITGVTSAFAATTWTVRPGSAISLSSGRFTVGDTPTGTMIVCSPSSLSGTLDSGSGHPGTGIGSITAVRIRSCGNLGMFTSGPGKGKPVPHQRFLLSRSNLVRYEHPLMRAGCEPAKQSS